MAEQVDLTTIPISPDGGNKPDGAAAESTGDGKPVTVFHDKDNFNVKHPLSNRWTLWFTKPASGKVRSGIQPRHFHTILTYLQTGRQLERPVKGSHHIRVCGGILGYLREMQFAVYVQPLKSP